VGSSWSLTLDLDLCRRCAASLIELDGDEGGDAVELDHCSANLNANPRIGGLIQTSDECYSPGRETAVERRGRFLASWRRDDEHEEGGTGGGARTKNLAEKIAPMIEASECSSWRDATIRSARVIVQAKKFRKDIEHLKGIHMFHHRIRCQ
jgi:hypothetical protein